MPLPGDASREAVAPVTNQGIRGPWIRSRRRKPRTLTAGRCGRSSTSCRARASSTALAEVHGEALRSISYAELAHRVGALANRLVGMGVAPGELVALLAPNGIDWVVARLALAAVGAVPVALDDLATEGELKAWLAELVMPAGADQHRACPGSAEDRLRSRSDGARRPAAGRNARVEGFAFRSGAGAAGTRARKSRRCWSTPPAPPVRQRAST